MLPMRWSRPLVLVAAAGLFAVGAAPAHAARTTESGPVTVARGLDNPRGLGFARDGSLYVAESGRGGDGPCFDGPEGRACFGASGAVTKVWKGKQKRVRSGLPSVAAPAGTNAIGPSDVAVDRRGMPYVTVGLAANPALRDTLPQLDGMSRLVRLQHGVRTVADLGDFEAAANPDGGAPDTNPTSVLTTRSHGQVVADAGANALLRVSPGRKVSALAVFPERMVDAPPFLGLPPGTTIPMQSVPTAVAVGPDGAYYVGELTGFPFPAGRARVYRVVPGHAPTVYATGFTNIIDVAFDEEDHLYVLEIAKNGLLSGDTTGALLRASKTGKHRTVLSRGLVSPGGLAIRDDHAYVSNCGTCPGTGTVLRVDLD